MRDRFAAPLACHASRCHRLVREGDLFPIGPRHAHVPSARLGSGRACRLYPVLRGGHGQNPVAVLESTPSYMYSTTALRVLPGLPSRPRVVFMLREPSAQIYSLFRYFQSNWNWIPPGITFRDFVQQALAGEQLEYRGNELAKNALRNARFVDSFGHGAMRSVRTGCASTFSRSCGPILGVLPRG